MATFTLSPTIKYTTLEFFAVLATAFDWASFIFHVPINPSVPRRGGYPCSEKQKCTNTHKVLSLHFFSVFLKVDVLTAVLPRIVHHNHPRERIRIPEWP